jgi:hypothetical protein
MREETPDLGSCCCCGKTGPSVRNVMMLKVKAPVAGRGWGCFVCGLPSDGAVAVLCDECLGDKPEGSQPDIKFACIGYPQENQRVPLDQLTEPFDHIISRHEPLN